MEYRAATSFTGGHSDDVDYVSWNPTHPELFCTTSQKDRRIVFWDARRESSQFHSRLCDAHLFASRKSIHTANCTQSISSPNELLSRWPSVVIHLCRSSALLHDFGKRERGSKRTVEFVRKGWSACSHFGLCHLFAYSN